MKPIVNARNCCETMVMELTAWKAILYDITRKMDKLPGGAKQEILPNIEDLHIMIEEMDNRIEQVREKCTPETCIDDIKTEREEFNETIAEFRVKAEDAIQYIGGGNLGG